MNASNLDRYATFLRNYPTNPNGASVDDWREIGSGWVSKQDVGGKTAYLSAREVAQIETNFTTRWRDDVEAGMRLQIETRVYDITRVDEIGRHEGLTIYGKVRAK